MLLRGQKPSERIHQFVIDPYELTPSRSPNAVGRRSAHTAKSKSRLSTPAANKTISIKPEWNNSNFSSNLKMNQSSEMLPREERNFVNVAPPVMHLDNLQLQDFLKLVIVGDKKISDGRSEDIIRSLNGTWFRNTQSNQKAAYRLFNSLGIKRTRIQTRGKQFSVIQNEDSSEILRRQYSPPNKFPAKKYSSKKYNTSKLDLSASAKPQRLYEQSPLKAKIMRKMPQSQPKINTSFKRSFSHLERKKHQPPNEPAKGPSGEGLIMGRRMILYKD